MAFLGEAVVDADLAAVDLLPVHGLDGGGGRVQVAVGDEAEAAGGVGLAVPDEGAGLDLAMGRGSWAGFRKSVLETESTSWPSGHDPRQYLPKRYLNSFSSVLGFMPKTPMTLPGLSHLLSEPLGGAAVLAILCGLLLGLPCLSKLLDLLRLLERDLDLLRDLSLSCPIVVVVGWRVSARFGGFLVGFCFGSTNLSRF